MKSVIILAACMISLSVMSQQHDFDDAKWDINAQNSRIETFKGKKCLYLESGLALLTDVNFQDGTIAFDIALPRGRSFSGLMWRLQDDGNYEECYFRTHRSGFPDALQYTPVWNRTSAWQLYHDQATSANDGNRTWEFAGEQNFNTLYDFRPDEWMHVELKVIGQEAWLFLDGNAEPILHISQLLRPEVVGRVGLKSGLAGARFANFTVTPEPRTHAKAVDAKTVQAHEDVVTEWRISQTFEETTFANRRNIKSIDKGVKWETVHSDDNGLLNISQYRSRQRTDSTNHNTVLVKHIIKSKRAEVKRMRFGYSDRVRVYVNGRPVYQGNNTYRSRDFRFLGTIGYFDEVFLQLGAGRNEIVFVVSESFGGWGLQARVEDVVWDDNVVPVR